MTTHAKDHEKKDKIHEALELLNEAAKEKKDEVYGVINSKYEHLREMFAGVAENGQSLAEDATKNISKTWHAEEKKIKKLAADWDKEVRENPWTYIGGAALGSLCLGLILGRKK